MPLVSRNTSLPRATEISARIRGERKRLGLTVEEAAARLGVHPSSYRYYEGSVDPKMTLLISLGRAGFDLKQIAPELFE